MYHGLIIGQPLMVQLTPPVLSEMRFRGQLEHFCYTTVSHSSGNDIDVDAQDFVVIRKVFFVLEIHETSFYNTTI